MAVGAETPLGALVDRGADGRTPQRIQVVGPEAHHQRDPRRDWAITRGLLNIEPEDFRNRCGCLVTDRPEAGRRTQRQAFAPPPQGQLTMRGTTSLFAEL